MSKPTPTPTPGRWTAVQRKWGYPETEGGPERRLWDVHDNDGTPVAMGTIYSVDNSDALLIAAAPELLEALQELYIWANTNDPGDHAGNDTAPLNRARAAIAKATGAK